MIDFLLSIEEHKEEYDSRQAWKIRYPLSTILFLVFSCQLAGIETWKEMEDFIEMNESVLGEYLGTCCEYGQSRFHKRTEIVLRS